MIKSGHCFILTVPEVLQHTEGRGLGVWFPFGTLGRCRLHDALTRNKGMNHWQDRNTSEARGGNRPESVALRVRRLQAEDVEESTLTGAFSAGARLQPSVASSNEGQPPVGLLRGR